MDKRREGPVFGPLTYLITILYIVMLALSIFYWNTDSTFSLQTHFRTTHTHNRPHKKTHSSIQRISPALRKIIKEHAKPLQFALIILAVVIAVMIIVQRFLVDKIEKRWWFTTDTKKNRKVATREISKQLPKHVNSQYGCSDTATNELTSTFQGSYLTVMILSFLYGSVQYLAQRMQVWCLAIACVQLALFYTGKSFWPLIIFTVVIAVMYTYRQLSIWQMDKKRNDNPIKLVNGQTIRSGDLRPGHEIKIFPDELIPADILITSVDDPKRRFYLNEVQVTGENTPVRKLVYKHTVEKIEIKDLNERKLIVTGETTRVVDDTMIGFANSLLISGHAQDEFITGIVCWVNRETKALSEPKQKMSQQPSPFTEYTNKAFLVSLITMLTLAFLDAVVAYISIPEEEAAKKKNKLLSFGTILVNHVMYLNMLVPQAIEQLRLTVCSLLSFSFRSKVQCNNPLVADVWASITRIVTDKTGTLTENKMIPKIQVIYAKDGDKWTMKDVTSIQDLQDTDLENHILAIMSTTGMEPEEISIASCVKAFYELGTTTDTEIHYGDTETLIVHHAFGFVRELLAKPTLFSNKRTGKYYMGVQAGGDDFWKGKTHVTPHEDTLVKLTLWDTQTPVNTLEIRGAPRLWSHGVKEITKEEAETIISKWNDCESIHDDVSRKEAQLKVLREAVARVPLISRTFMVDSYRKGVKAGIQKLYKEGKQVFICTGDAVSAAKTIAENLDFPTGLQAMDLHGGSEEALITSLRNAIRMQTVIEPPSPASTRGILKLDIDSHSRVLEQGEPRLQSLSIFVDQACMELFRSIQEREGGYKGEAFELFFKLIEARKAHKPHKIGRSLNYIVFCRATPALKPWVVQLMQHGHPPLVHDHSLASRISNVIRRTFNPGRHYVLAIGDGANDINMIKVADASLGIKSTDTSDVCNAASVWHTEWKPVITLLLEDGPEKATLLSTMVKATFLKHWMTAMALWADLLFSGFTLFPMDPTHPILMMFYNAVVFMQISSHTGHDVVPERIRAQLRIKNLMSVRAFLRWAMAAILSGFAIVWIVRYLFPDAKSNEFGAMIQVAQCFSVTVYLLLSTNAWTDHEKNVVVETDPEKPVDLSMPPTKAEITQVAAGLASISVGLGVIFLAFKIITTSTTSLWVVIALVSFISLYLARALLILVARDVGHMREQVGKALQAGGVPRVERFIAWSHTINGRLLPILIFLFSIKIISGASVSFVALIIISTLTSAVSCGIFLIVISRIGFMRALLDGKSIAIGLVGVFIGVMIGRQIPSTQ